MTRLLAAILILMIANTAHATDWYVSAEFGNDANPGTAAEPFATPQRAHESTEPGDVVYVMNGTYRAGVVLGITRSGTPDAWITYRNYPGHKPKFEYWSWGGIMVWGASYIEIRGFEVEGNLANIDFADAEANNQNTDIPDYQGLGIGVNRNFDVPIEEARWPHHVRVIGNEVYNNPGGGIQSVGTDYFYIEDNLIYRSGWYAPWGMSGISIYQPRNQSDDQSEYRHVIRGNTSHSNYNFFNCFCSNYQSVTDGNGIIIDDTKHTQGGSTHGPYTGRTLVSNNVLFGNGARGVNVYESENVDVFNNTTYNNLLHPELSGGEITVGASANVRVQNNIAYATSGNKSTQSFQISNVFGNDNLLWGSSSNDLIGPDDVYADPSLTQLPPSAPFPTYSDFHLGADFRLMTGSPAIDAGTPLPAVPTDKDGDERPQGLAYDIGAYEGSGGEEVACSGTGMVLREWWLNLPGNTVAALTGSPNYPDHPDGSVALPIAAFEGPYDWGDEFGARYRGYLEAPVSGDYVFSFSSDDGGELWISSDASPANRSLVASVPDYAVRGNFDKYPSQVSDPVALEEGRQYYVEVLHKEGGVADHVQVAWQLPGRSRTLIPGSCLSADIGVSLDLKISLQGAFQNGGPMETVPEIPESQPFLGDPWLYNGAETKTTNDPDVVDWVLIELRQSPDEPAINRRAVLLRADGSLLEPDGSFPVRLPGVGAGRYHVVVRHRNHLSVRSFGEVELTDQ